MLDYENEDNPYNDKKSAISEWVELSIEDVEPSEEIFEIAEEIKAAGVKNKDAIHIACAIVSQCDYFITVDKRASKYKTDKLKVVDTLSFVKDWSENND
jgi:predicted nucleic acid-binding protein